MPRTIQQFNDEYTRIKKAFDEATKQSDVIYSKARALFKKSKANDKDDWNVRSFLEGRYNPSERQIQVWNKLSPQAKSNFTNADKETFYKVPFRELDAYVRGDVNGWWQGKFDGRKTFYNAWGNANTWGINGYGYGNFREPAERNTYMLGALYADNYIGSLSSPFLNVESMSGDGIGNRAGQHYVGAYNILKSGIENVKVLKQIAGSSVDVVYLNNPQESEAIQKEYLENEKVLKDLRNQMNSLDKEKQFMQPEKLELISQYQRLSGSIDNLSLKVSNLEQNQKAQKNLTDSFFKGSGKGMSIRDELMSQSESLQNDISNLSIGFKQNKESINSINKKVSGLGEKFADLKNLYSVNESKLKNESQFFKKNIESLNISQREINTSTVTLGDKILNLQQKMDDNSKNYAIEKGKILEEIEGLKTKGEGFSPAINDLNAKLTNLTKAHDLVKNTLLGKMKTLEEFNKTKFIEIENKNEDFKKRYDKDTGQLQRELGVVRAGIDERGRETSNLAGEVAQTREEFGNFEKQSNVKFKTLFDYNTYTNRQIKKQNTNKLTTLGNIRKAAQPDLLKKAFAGLIRGRFFDTQPILY